MAPQPCQSTSTPQTLAETLHSLTIKNINKRACRQLDSKELTNSHESSTSSKHTVESINNTEHFALPDTPNTTFLEDNAVNEYSFTPNSSQESGVMVFLDDADEKSANDTTRLHFPKQVATFKLNPRKMGSESVPPSVLFPTEHTPVLSWQEFAFNNSKLATREQHHGAQGHSLASSKASAGCFSPTLGTSSSADSIHIDQVNHEQYAFQSDGQTTPDLDTHPFADQHTILEEHFQKTPIRRDPSPLLNAYGLPVAYNEYVYKQVADLPTNYICRGQSQSMLTAHPRYVLTNKTEGRHIDASSYSTWDQSGNIPRQFEYNTNTDKLEPSAGSARSEHGLSSTKSASLWPTGLTDWRDRSQRGGCPTHQFVANQPKAARPFEPMMCLQNPALATADLDISEIKHRLHNGISLNYRGQSHNVNNISRDIPHSENAAVWLTNLPPTITVQELLGAVTSHGPMGRIWSTHINPPKGTSLTPYQQIQPTDLPLSHRTSAAKIIFYQPFEAQRLLALANRRAFILLDRCNGQHYVARATHNRQRTPAQPMPNETSRVLLIAGPKWFVSEEKLHELFSLYFVYQTEEVVVLKEDKGASGAKQRVLEWRFGSMRAQAQAAYRLLTGPGFEDVVSVAWGRDPCEDGRVRMRW